jgi:hypothetical protein
MPDCPNCGRPTLRTKDWVCQWCGYPLVSDSYKVIDKTFKELQDERKPAYKTISLPEEIEPAPVYQPEPEPKTEQPVKPDSTPQFKPLFTSPPQSSIESEPIPVRPPEPQPGPEPPPEPVAPVQPQSMIENPLPAEEAPVQLRPEAELPPSATEIPIQLRAETELPPASEVTPTAEFNPPPQPPPQDEVAPEPAPLLTPPPVQKSPLPSGSKPEFFAEPEPPPEPMITLEDVEDGMAIAVEQIDSLFRTNKEAANSTFADKTFIIQGIVEKTFIREHLDIRYILLTGIMKGITWSLRCTFEKENAGGLTNLQEGQAVTIQGTYDSYGKNIIFKDCALV